MPKLLRRTIYTPTFRQDTFGLVVGVECKGLGKLSVGYREKCYGGDELQFRMRSARPQFSPFGDAYANAELRKLGLNGPTRYVCPNCWMEASVSGKCEC